MGNLVLIDDAFPLPATTTFLLLQFQYNFLNVNVYLFIQIKLPDHHNPIRLFLSHTNDIAPRDHF